MKVRRSYPERITICRRCRGTGRVKEAVCRQCEGTGRVTVQVDSETEIRPYRPEKEP